MNIKAMKETNNSLDYIGAHCDMLIDKLIRDKMTNLESLVQEDEDYKIEMARTIKKRALLMLHKIKLSDTFSFLDRKTIEGYNRIIDDFAKKNTSAIVNLSNKKNNYNINLNNTFKEINYLNNLKSMVAKFEKKINDIKTVENDTKANLANIDLTLKADNKIFDNILENIKTSIFKNLQCKIDVPNNLKVSISSFKPSTKFTDKYNEITYMLTDLVSNHNEVRQDIVSIKNNLDALVKTNKDIVMNDEKKEEVKTKLIEMQKQLVEDEDKLKQLKVEVLSAPAKTIEIKNKTSELEKEINSINNKIVKNESMKMELLDTKKTLLTIADIDRNNSNIVSKAMNKAFPEVKKNEKLIVPKINKKDMSKNTFGDNIYSDLIKGSDNEFLNRWYAYLQDLLMKPPRDFIIDKNNITNFKIVFKNPETGLSTEKETIVQLNHSISSHSSPVFGIGSSTFQGTSRGVKLMAGTLVTNAFENVPLPHLHSISYSTNADICSLPLLDMYIIPIEDLSDGRFEGLVIKGIKFIDMRQTDGASSGGRYYAFNFIAKDFIPVDFSTLSQFYN